MPGRRGGQPKPPPPLPELTADALEHADEEELKRISDILDQHEMLASPSSCAQLLSRSMSEKWLPYRHLELLNEKLIEVEARHIKRLIVTMPPRHGKSLMCSQYFPAWYLNRHPTQNVILCSYEADFAATWGRRVRDLIENNVARFRIRISGGSKAANRWNVSDGQGRTGGGGMVTAGVGGPITGRGANVLIIDDPVKNAEEAGSQAMRDRAWDWWRMTAYTRLEPNGVVIVIQTRWHEDDLAGRLLDEEPDKWTIINLPALAEENDPMGRDIGEPLCPERFDANALGAIRETLGSDGWTALYQQRPAPEGGGRFKRSTFRYWSPRAADEKTYTLHDPDGSLLVKSTECWRLMTVDLAATERTSGDYTVAAVWDIAPYLDPPRLILVHRERKRVVGADHIPMLTTMNNNYKPSYIGVERAAVSIAVIQNAIRSGLPIRELRPDRDKWSRSEMAATYCENGRVYFPRHAPWLSEWEHELLTFPAGTHDDQVDSFAYAALEMSRGINMLQRPKKRDPVTLEERVAAYVDKNHEPSFHPELGRV